jgi:hypothetical protein
MNQFKDIEDAVNAMLSIPPAGNLADRAQVLERFGKVNAAHVNFMAVVTPQRVRELLDALKLAEIANSEDGTEDEISCAEEWLDHYAAQLNLGQTHFECVGDYIKAVVEAAMKVKGASEVQA